MQLYFGKISGPLLDCIDLHVEVEPVSFEKKLQKPALQNRRYRLETV